MLLGRNSAEWIVGVAAAALTLTLAHPAMAQSATITAYFRDPTLVGYVYPGPANAVFQIPVTLPWAEPAVSPRRPTPTCFTPTSIPPGGLIKSRSR